MKEDIVLCHQCKLGEHHLCVRRSVAGIHCNCTVCFNMRIELTPSGRPVSDAEKQFVKNLAASPVVNPAGSVRRPLRRPLRAAWWFSKMSSDGTHPLLRRKNENQ